MAVIYKKTLEQKTQEITKLRERLNELRPEIKMKRSASRSGNKGNVTESQPTNTSNLKKVRSKSRDDSQKHKRSKSQSMAQTILY